MPSSALNREAIEAEIDRVRSLGLDELRTLWRATFRSPPPPAFAKNLIARFLCWHIQEQAVGELDAETTRCCHEASHLNIVARQLHHLAIEVGNLLLDGLTRLEERFDRGGEFRPSLGQLHGAHEEHVHVDR